MDLEVGIVTWYPIQENKLQTIISSTRHHKIDNQQRPSPNQNGRNLTGPIKITKPIIMTSPITTPVNKKVHQILPTDNNNIHQMYIK